MEKRITRESLELFEKRLRQEEKAALTVSKYLRDVRRFLEYVGEGGEADKEHVLRYKQYLKENYRISSANSMLAALNMYLRFMGWEECRVRQFKVQRSFFCRKEEYLSKEEYERLLSAAGRQGDEQLGLIMQTLCSTGIRIGELGYITAEAVAAGETAIWNKGKERRIFLPGPLVRLLSGYCARRKITSGPVFVTGKRQPVSRGSVWRRMKGLCRQAGVEEEKVFPHNLRHLFAFTFYQAKKDLLYLAEILGHTSVETTRIYTRTPGQGHRKLISSLGLVYEKGERKRHNLNYVSI